MASGSQPGLPITLKQTFSVRLPVDSKKKYSILKFNPANNVDFAKCDGAKIERENNLKDFKSAYDIDSLPKFGAGSEFGREQREEARKKKFGVRIRKYNSEEQPWLLKLSNGPGKQPRRFKGVREGGVAENASFYIFMQCSDNKTFEAIPIDEWYNFTPQVKYKYLDTDEAEQEYTKRDKTLNYFNIMLRKRLKNDDLTDDVGNVDGADEAGKKNSKKNKTDKALTISEFDEWSNSSDDDDDEEDETSKDGKAADGKSRQKKSGKSKASEDHRSRKKKKTAEGSEDEAVEESDEADEGEEVDYMSGSSSDDEQMYDDKARDESDKYQDKGVEDEEGLRKLVDSGDEDEEDEKKDEENEEDEDSRLRDDKAKESNSETSSDSDSDSDPEKDSNFASALFMTEKRQQSVMKSETTSNSRPSTPSSNSMSSTSAVVSPGTSSVTADIINKVKKRKAETQSPQAALKKVKSETVVSQTNTSMLQSSTVGEGITEEVVRRYLMRKPMTTKDLVQKFKSRNAGMSKEQMTTTIAHILKRLNPQKKTIKDKMYLFLDKTPN